MSEQTANLGLTLPDYLEDADIEVLNENFEIIDDAVSDKIDASALADVATSGAYSDLSGTPTIDSALDSESTNAVQNAIVTAALAGKWSLQPATSIPDGTPDSDGYKADILTLDVGKWSRASNLKYVKNRPSNFNGINDSFYVIVEYVISTSRKKITLYPLNDTNGNHLCWVIYQAQGGGFGNWHYFGGGESVSKYVDPVT